MRRLLMVATALLLCLPVAEGRAQQAALPEPPVRYDADLLPPSFHRDRRAAVLAALPPDAVAVFFSAPARNRENDVAFEYRQDSDLYYLTGTTEAASVLLLAPGGLDVDGATVTELLLTPPRDPASEVWTGRRFGAERAQAELGLQKAVSNERFEEILGALAAREGVRFFHLPFPAGVEAGSELGGQIDFFVERARPLVVEGSPLARNAMSFVLGLDDAARFAQVRPFLAGRLSAEDFATPALREAYQAFVEAETFEAWQAWRRQHLDAHYADGVTLRRLLNGLRMVKTEAELALMQRAIDITVAAHREAMKSIEPGMHEYEAEALIEYIFKRNGAEYTGFPSIVGSGENATTLHYESNRRRMQAGDVVVMDIGAEYHGYSADVTRTVPVGGTFSPEQQTIYELVLKAQQAGIEAARKGNAFGAPGQAAWRVIADGLQALGLIEQERDARRFFMHGTSHYLGLYVHDVGDAGPLAPGVVLTVEPGVYISPAPDVDPKWWNIGVRIEDDVLVTEGDPVVLSAGAPRTVEEIEALMKEQGLGNEAAGLVKGAAQPQGAMRGSQ